VPNCFLATSTDGAHVLQWEVEAYYMEHTESNLTEFLWERDSNGFVRLRYNTQGTGMDQVEFRSLVQPDPSQGRSNPTRIHTLAKNTVGGKAVGWTEDGRALIANWFANDPDETVYFAALDVHTPDAPPRLYAHKPPEGMYVQALAL